MINLNENFYKKILDSLYDGVYFVDSDRKITYWNQLMYKGKLSGRNCVVMD